MERREDSEELRSDRAFAELLGKSPPRPQPPAGDEAMIREAVYAEWRQVAGRRVQRRRIVSLALAASLAIVAFTILDVMRDPLVDISDYRMAAIEKQFGRITINAQLLRPGQAASIAGADKVETGPRSGLALRWHDGGSLRVGENTSLVFETSDRVYLREGRVYFDSKNSPLVAGTAGSRSGKIAIRTDYGIVRNHGTQYMARAGAGELVVSVREGVVAIDARVAVRASAGQQLAISESGEWSIADTNGVDDWEWVEDTTPAVDLEGVTVAGALAWVSRESGRAIRYSSEAAEELANEAELKGFTELPPSRALRVFMMTTDLDARIEGEVIVVSEN